MLGHRFLSTGKTRDPRLVPPLRDYGFQIPPPHTMITIRTAFSSPYGSLRCILKIARTEFARRAERGSHGEG